RVREPAEQIGRALCERRTEHFEVRTHMREVRGRFVEAKLILACEPIYGVSRDGPEGGAYPPREERRQRRVERGPVRTKPRDEERAPRLHRVVGDVVPLPDLSLLISRNERRARSNLVGVKGDVP